MWNNFIIKLLPRQFLFLGWGLIGLAFVCLFLPYSKQALITLATQCLTAGLFTLSIVRQKSEDEMTVMFRCFAWISAMLFVSIVIIIEPVINWGISGQYDLKMPPIRIVLLMFIFYFGSFEVLKRQAKKRR